MRFVGNNAEKYVDGDIILLGSDLPHYMKSDDVYQKKAVHSGQQVLSSSLKKDFMHHAFNYYPHFIKIKKSA